MSAITGKSWTCSRCKLRIGYLPGRGPAAGIPPGMTEVDGRLVCLGCRRADVKAEADASYVARPGLTRRQHVVNELALDELERNPNRSDVEIGKSLHTAPSTVRRQRELLTTGRKEPGGTG